MEGTLHIMLVGRRLFGRWWNGRKERIRAVDSRVSSDDVLKVLYVDFLRLCLTMKGFISSKM